MLKSRWIIYRKLDGIVTGMVIGLPPEESEFKGVMEHPVADMHTHKVDLDTLEVFEHIYQPVITKEDLRNEFTQERNDLLSKSTVEYQGMVFDSDEVSQNRMLRPIAVLQNDTDTQLWVLHDNTVVNLTKPQFIAVLALAGQQQTEMWVQP